MDVPVTLLTITAVYMVVKYINSIWPNGFPSQLKVPLALLVGIGVTFVMAQTDFASQQRFFDTNLKLMNGWSQVMVGVVLGLGASGLDTTFKSIAGRAEINTNNVSNRNVTNI